MVVVREEKKSSVSTEERSAPEKKKSNASEFANQVSKANSRRVKEQNRQAKSSANVDTQEIGQRIAF